jgi:predicted nucleic acid-binding protein
MSYVALDTDVVSKLIKRQLPATLLARLADRIPCVTFVTIAELTEWAIVQSWRQRSHAELDRWLTGVWTQRAVSARLSPWSP